MRRGYGAGLFLAGTLWGGGLVLAGTLLPLASTRWKVVLSILMVAVPAAAVWLLTARRSANEQPQVGDKATSDRIIKSLDSLSTTLRDNAVPREVFKELTVAITALPDKLARALQALPSGSTGSRTGESSPSRGSTEPSPKPAKEPRREERSAPTAAGDIAAKLVRAWTSYFDDGDGRFTVAGLQWFLEKEGLPRDSAHPGDRFGIGDDVLAVAIDGSGEVYLLPNFTTSVHALSNRFEVGKGVARDATVRRLKRPAVARHGRSGFEIVSKGAVE